MRVSPLEQGVTVKTRDLQRSSGHPVNYSNALKPSDTIYWKMQKWPFQQEGELSLPCGILWFVPLSIFCEQFKY